MASPGAINKKSLHLSAPTSHAPQMSCGSGCSRYTNRQPAANGYMSCNSNGCTWIPYANAPMPTGGSPGGYNLYNTAAPYHNYRPRAAPPLRRAEPFRYLRGPLRGAGADPGDRAEVRGTPVTQLTPETYNQFVQAHPGNNVIAFEADWCGHCKAMEPDSKPRQSRRNRSYRGSPLLRLTAGFMGIFTPPRGWMGTRRSGRIQGLGKGQWREFEGDRNQKRLYAFPGAAGGQCSRRSSGGSFCNLCLIHMASQVSHVPGIPFYVLPRVSCLI